MANIFAVKKNLAQQLQQTAQIPTGVADTGPVNAKPIQQPAQQGQVSPQETQREQWQPSYKTMPTINPNSATDGMDALASLYTSPLQEEKYRRASVANRKIYAVADALRNIGNIFNTVNYAPNQQFNSPAVAEKANYEKEKAYRDALNQRYAQYKQAKAAQDAQQQRWETNFKYNMYKDAATADALRKYREDQLSERRRTADNTLAFNEKKQKATEDRWKRQDAETKRYHNATIGQKNRSLDMQQQRTTAYVNRQNSAGKGGGKTAPLDTPKGKITPNGASYSNQLLQMWDYAKEKGFIKDSDVSARLRQLGMGNDQSDNVKRQQVMELLRTRPELGEYASRRLGWTYGESDPASSWDEYLEEEDNWSQYED